MKQKILSQIFLFSVIAFFSILFIKCDENETPYSYQIFYLEDSNLSYSDIENLPIDKLVLKKNPVITDKDIESITVLYLENNPIQSYRFSYNHSVKANFGEQVRPFVLLLNGQRFYTGECWPNFISIVPGSILLYRIRENESWLQPIDDKGNAKLKDQRIFETLKNLGVVIKYENIG
ncbi:MAG: hypothetical protein C4539_07345 [Ignavibacteriales bacterium]|nr:MAG: hypothetical protein C4539_07345 [Ignavibacteriales bacterium]